MDGGLRCLGVFSFWVCVWCLRFCCWVIVFGWCVCCSGLRLWFEVFLFYGLVCGSVWVCWIWYFSFFWCWFCSCEFEVWDLFFLRCGCMLLFCWRLRCWFWLGLYRDLLWFLLVVVFFREFGFCVYCGSGFFYGSMFCLVMLCGEFESLFKVVVV